MLQGSLQNFALDEVLGLLASTAKTGRLRVDGDRGDGTLSIVDGQLTEAVTSCTTNGTEPTDVVFELLRFVDGSFSFDVGEVEPVESPSDILDVLAAAADRLGDWREIEAVVPSLDHNVVPIAELATDEVTIDRDEWAVLRIVGAGCPVSVICDKLELGEVEGSRRIKELSERDLLTVGPPVVAAQPTTAPTNRRSLDSLAGGTRRSGFGPPPASGSYPRRAATDGSAVASEPRASATAFDAQQAIDRRAPMATPPPPGPPPPGPPGEQQRYPAPPFEQPTTDASSAPPFEQPMAGVGAFYAGQHYEGGAPSGPDAPTQPPAPPARPSLDELFEGGGDLFDEVTQYPDASGPPDPSGPADPNAGPPTEADNQGSDGQRPGGLLMRYLKSDD